VAQREAIPGGQRTRHGLQATALAVAALALGACAPAAPAGGPAGAAAPAAKPAASAQLTPVDVAARPAPQTPALTGDAAAFERVKQAAQREGHVVVAGPTIPEVRTAISEAFQTCACWWASMVQNRRRVSGASNSPLTCSLASSSLLTRAR